jgi:hypothetical protein
MTRIFTDSLIMDAKPRVTVDGYMVAMPKAARIGMQDYTGAELGRPDLKVVRVYRPEEEVFNKDSLGSFAHKPITIEHPPVLVDAGNWKKYASGQIGDEIARDGDFIRVPMMIADQKAIDAINAGKVELSMGYTCDIDFVDGTAPDGTAYNAVQRNIRGNHLAIVDSARGGSQLRVIDYKPQETETMTHQVIVDGVSLQVADATTAQLIAKALKDAKAEVEKATTDKDALDKKISDMEMESSELKKQRDAEKTTNDSIIADLKTKLADAQSPAAIDSAVKARALVIDSAKKVLAAVVVDGKSDEEIKRQVVDAKLGDAAKGWDAGKIDASFTALCAAGVAVDPYRKAVADSSGVNLNDADAAYKQYCADLQNAHKHGRE